MFTRKIKTLPSAGKTVSLITLSPIVNINGGMEKAICDLASALCGRYNVRILFCEPRDGRPDFPLSPEVELFNLFPIPPSLLSSSVCLTIRAFARHKAERKRRRRSLQYLQTVDRIRKFDAVNPSDLFIAFGAYSAALTQIAVGPSKPVVCSLHACMNVFEEDFSRFHEAMKGLTAFHVLLPSYKNTLKTFFPDVPIRPIPNPVIPQPTQSNLSKKTIINVARIAEHKRFHLLVEAFALIKQRFPEWTIENWGMVSEDYYLEKVEAVMAEKQLEDRIHLRGVTTDIPEKLLTASVFVLPSYNEGFSLAMTEAMATGLPVIVCNDCLGVDELIENGKSGLIVPPTPEALASAIAKLIENPSLRHSLGRQAKEEMAQYAPEKIWSRWREFVDELIGQEPPGD